MMRSLWSGVTGLQAHQIAMDVEGNNIANVNTNGYKYSRPSFADLMSQTTKIATASQGDMGGKNPMQIGLGTQINSVKKIFSQGSVQTTDKNTDLAIQGDGFFVISGDGGKTLRYTRNGDFGFDSNGNFVDNNGYVIQGWMRDEDTNMIDSTAPIDNIVIPPGLTTPAKQTDTVTLKANLNAGDTVINKSPIRELDSTAGLDGADATTQKDDEKEDDFGVLFNTNGESYQIRDEQGVKISFDGGTNTKEFRYTSDDSEVDTEDSDSDGKYYFRTTEDLRAAIQHYANTVSNGATVTVNQHGKYEITNKDGNADLDMQLESIVDNDTTENERFTKTLQTMVGKLESGSETTRSSQDVYAATHASSIDVFDSLGIKHTIRFEFRKSSYLFTTGGTKAGSVWEMVVSVPEPGDIGGSVFENIIEGEAVFNNDGSIASYSPSSITYTSNNGAVANQVIEFQFGSAGKFEGLTSFDSESATSGISQNGYSGGDVVGIRIDESGTLVGSFTNGKSFPLARVAMAKFVNNAGLESSGSNVFIETANSGEAIIGKASTGGRGMIQSSALEMSNVDLSRSLTQLIVVQRGFQANSKTITTSDQMLNTLLQLKQ